jgi:hypothetical protein
MYNHSIEKSGIMKCFSTHSVKISTGPVYSWTRIDYTVIVKLHVLPAASLAKFTILTQEGTDLKEDLKSIMPTGTSYR